LGAVSSLDVQISSASPADAVPWQPRNSLRPGGDGFNAQEDRSLAEQVLRSESITCCWSLPAIVFATQALICVSAGAGQG